MVVSIHRLKEVALPTGQSACELPEIKATIALPTALKVRDFIREVQNIVVFCSAKVRAVTFRTTASIERNALISPLPNGFG